MWCNAKKNNKYLRHVWGKDHGYVAGIHFVGGLLLHNISHEVDSPVKQGSLSRWQQPHKSYAFLLSIAIHDLISCENIQYALWQLPEPGLLHRK